jgi:TRAP-type C4-dicarboxylate transport system substrate-binding protein
MTIKIADKGTLYATQNDALTAISSGAIQLTYSGPHFLEQLDPAWKLGEAPGVFDNWAHFLKTMQTPAWKELQERMAKDKNVTILNWAFDTGTWFLFTNKGPIKTLEDIKGLRIRFAGGEAFAKALKAMGVNPVALPYSEVVTALQTNMVDGVLTDMTGGMYFYNLERYCPHLTLVPWAIQPISFVVSTKWYEGLDPKVREAFTSPFQRIDLSKFFTDFEEMCIKKWSAGPKTKTYVLEKAETAKWQNTMKAAVQDMLAGIDQKYVKAVDETRK